MRSSSRPNAPADFENPFHVYLFEPAHLVSMMALFFEEVECLGLEGDEVLALRLRVATRERREDPEARSVRICAAAFRGARTCGRTSTRCPLVYRMLGSDRSGVGSGIDASHLFIADEITPQTPVLFAIGRRPRARVPTDG